MACLDTLFTHTPFLVVRIFLMLDGITIRNCCLVCKAFLSLILNEPKLIFTRHLMGMEFNFYKLLSTKCAFFPFFLCSKYKLVSSVVLSACVSPMPVAIVVDQKHIISYLEVITLLNFRLKKHPVMLLRSGTVSQEGLEVMLRQHRKLIFTMEDSLSRRVEIIANELLIPFQRIYHFYAAHLASKVIVSSDTFYEKRIYSA